MLGFDTEVSEAQRGILEEAESAVAMMVNILEGVLDTAAIESGRLQLDLRVCDLEALTSRAIALNLLSARRAGVQVALQSFGALRVTADETKLHQVLNNLLNNAINHSPSGSTVDVTIERRAAETCIRVQDQGSGVPQHERELIFDPFQRGSKTERPGTGGGACFELRLPLPPHAKTAGSAA